MCCFKKGMSAPKRLVDSKAWCPNTRQKHEKYHKIEELSVTPIKPRRELEKHDTDLLIFCYKAKCTVQWAEEHIRNDVCRLSSKLASTINTQIGSS